MHKTFVATPFAYLPSEEQREGRAREHDVVIVGAGPVGLTLALDCAARGLRCVLLDDNDRVSTGSRAVCYAQRSLAIWQRLGVAAPLLAQGVRWKRGKVFQGEALAYAFDLQPQPHEQLPAMINLQQYHLEAALVAACQASPLIELRWKHRLVGLEQWAQGVRLQVETPDGRFEMHAQWLLACDGAGSDVRRLVGASFEGQAFHDRFLIADVLIEPESGPALPEQLRGRGHALRRLDAEPERWFWFDPPFHPGQSVLLHKQCDQVWRIDFQLGQGADPNEEKKPERVIPRIRAMLGDDVPFELEWVSVYQFACRRIERLRHGRVLFAGDAAHQVSPFGARGANSGVQDADNLAWKLAEVLQGEAPEALLDSYHEERSLAADENIRHSTRSTDFISPKTRCARRLRDAVLELARTEAFARPLVNSGRLSTPTAYRQSSLNTADLDDFDTTLRPGSPCADAPLRLPNGDACWLLQLLGQGSSLLVFGALPDDQRVQVERLGLRPLIVGDRLEDPLGIAAQRYDARPGTAYLIRPDQHVAARWRRLDHDALQAALRRARGQA